MIIKYAGRKQMQGKFSIIIDNGMAGVASSLETDNDIGFLRQHIRDLAFSFVTPVGAHDCSYHSYILLWVLLYVDLCLHSQAVPVFLQDRADHFV